MLSRRSLFRALGCALGAAALAPAAKAAGLLPVEPAGSVLRNPGFAGGTAIGGLTMSKADADPRLFVVDGSAHTGTWVADLGPPWPERTSRLRSHFRVTYGGDEGRWIPIKDALHVWQAERDGGRA